MFDELNPTQQFLVLILVRLQKLNPIWGDYENNFTLHYDNITITNGVHLQGLYISLFKRIETMYSGLAAMVAKENVPAHDEQREWIVTLMAEPYRCLEEMRTVFEPKYRPLVLDAITGSLRSHSNYGLYYHFLGLYDELKALRVHISGSTRQRG